MKTKEEIRELAINESKEVYYEPCSDRIAYQVGFFDGYTACQEKINESASRIADFTALMINHESLTIPIKYSAKEILEEVIKKLTEKI